MSGNLFKLDGFYTSSMTPEIYNRIKDRVQLILKHYFKHVAIPLDAPSKDDKGNLFYEKINVLVAEPANGTTGGLSAGYIATSLGAKCFGQEHVNDPVQVGLAWPDFATPNLPQPESEGVVVEQQINGSGAGAMKKALQPAVQVDVHVLDSAQTFKWRLFLHTQNDFWSIMDIILSPFGLAVTKSGFYLHISNAGKHNKNLGRVLMTTSPSEVLEYLQLSERRYWAFKSRDELLEFAASCRFHDPGLENDGVEKKSSLQKYWCEVYKPSHRHGEVGNSAGLSSEAVLDDVKYFFGARFKKAYDQGCQTYTRAFGENQLWSELGKYIKEEALQRGQNKVTRIAELGEEGAMSDLGEAVAGEEKLLEQGKALGTYAIKELKSQIKDNAKAKNASKPGFAETAFKDGRFNQAEKWAKQNWEYLGKERKIDEERQSREHITSAIAAGVQIKKRKSHGGQDLDGAVSQEQQPFIGPLNEMEKKAQDLKAKQMLGKKVNGK